jgi:DNA-binding FrmR family transcriptional regulator
MTGYGSDTTAYLARLRKAEGQIRGLQRMVDTDTYCIEIPTQVSAATKALQAIALGRLTTDVPLARPGHPSQPFEDQPVQVANHH